MKIRNIILSVIFIFTIMIGFQNCEKKSALPDDIDALTSLEEVVPDIKTPQSNKSECPLGFYVDGEECKMHATDVVTRYMTNKTYKYPSSQANGSLAYDRRDYAQNSSIPSALLINYLRAVDISLGYHVDVSTYYVFREKNEGMVELIECSYVSNDSDGKLIVVRSMTTIKGDPQCKVLAEGESSDSKWVYTKTLGYIYEHQVVAHSQPLYKCVQNDANGYDIMTSLSKEECLSKSYDELEIKPMGYVPVNGHQGAKVSLGANDTMVLTKYKGDVAHTSPEAALAKSVDNVDINPLTYSAEELRLLNAIYLYMGYRNIGDSYKVYRQSTANRVLLVNCLYEKKDKDNKYIYLQNATMLEGDESCILPTASEAEKEGKWVKTRELGYIEKSPLVGLIPLYHCTRFDSGGVDHMASTNQDRCKAESYDESIKIMGYVPE